MITDGVIKPNIAEGAIRNLTCIHQFSEFIDESVLNNITTVAQIKDPTKTTPPTRKTTPSQNFTKFILILLEKGQTTNCQRINKIIE